MDYKDRQFDIFVFGTGGTGGNFAELLCQFLNGVKKERYTLTFIDGDTVEEKNLVRQPFSADDIGKNKAEALASYLGNRHDLNIRFYDRYIDSVEQIDALMGNAKSMYKRLNGSYSGPDTHVKVLVGCVDNDACRKLIHEYFYQDTKYDAIYIDSGNEFDFGEVVFGIKKKGEVISPPKAYYYGEIMNGEHVSRSAESCEALNNAAPQHIVTNMLAANIIMTAFAQLFEDGKCPTGIVYFNSFNFTMRQQPFCPPENALKKIDLKKAGGALYDF